jgi:hypothetical protein
MTKGSQKGRRTTNDSKVIDKMDEIIDEADRPGARTARQATQAWPGAYFVVASTWT